MSLQLVSLASGSHGNCTYIGNKQEGILVDCGISFKRYCEEMQKHSLDPARVKAVFVTHEHGDHVGGIKTLENGYRQQGKSIQIWMHPDTQIASKVKAKQVEALTGSIQWKDWRIQMIPVPHDCAYPVVYTVSDQEDTVGVMTDFGQGTTTIHKAIQTCTKLLLEFNHDEKTLMEHPDYHWQLRQRIRSSHGHLSNAQAAELLSYASPSIKQVIGGHLSNKTNHPSWVHGKIQGILNQLGITASIEIKGEG